MDMEIEGGSQYSMRFLLPHTPPSHLETALRIYKPNYNNT